MAIFFAFLYYVKALPEAFRLMKQGAIEPPTESAGLNHPAEVSPGVWILQA